MKIIKKKILSTSLLVILGVLGIAQFTYALDIKPGDINLPKTEVDEIIVNIINWGAGIVALVSILVILIAGILWATSGGTEEGTKKARGMLLMGIVGLIIALAAWAIVNVVLVSFFKL